MSVRRASALAVGVSMIALTAAHGQTVTLPEIRVTAPSPIRRAPQPVTVAEPSTRTTAPAPTAPEPPLQGTLPVVTDQFATVTVVPAEELARNGGSTLGDLLLNRPGITASSFAPGAASRPIIRGLDNYRVRIQENGLAVNDVSDLSEDHGVPIDPLGAQQVEVIRGPATLRYGSQAIGGVVNVDNNRIPTFVPSRGVSGEIKGGFNSVDHGADGAVLLDAGHGRFAIHADAFKRRSIDYGIPAYPYLFPEAPAPGVNGRQPNSASRASGQSVGGSYIFDGGFVGVAVSQFDSFYGIPGQEAAETNTRIDLRQTKVTSKGEFRPQSAAVEAIRFWAGATDYKHDELANEGGFDGVQQSFINRAQEGRVEVQFSPLDLRIARLTTAIGVQGSRQRLAAPGLEGGLFDPNRTSSIAGYAFNELRFTDTTRAQVAGRIERVDVNGTGYLFPGDFLGPDPTPFASTPGFTPMSGSVGLLQDLPYGLVASVTAQYVERAPRAPELFSRGVHEATGTFEIGGPNLGIEAARGIEIGLRRAQGPLRFEATAYATKYTGFIFKRLTGNSCDEDFASCMAGPGGEFDQVVYSQQDATFHGAEIAAQLDVARVGRGWFGIDGQYDFVRATLSDGNPVPRLPPQRYGGGLFYRDAAWFARVGLLHADAQTRLSPEETPTADYNLLKAELSHTTRYAPAAGGPTELTLGVRGDNLLNEEIRNAVSFKKDEVLLPGRTVRVFARMVF